MWSSTDQRPVYSGPNDRMKGRTVDANGLVKKSGFPTAVPKPGVDAVSQSVQILSNQKP